MQCAKLKFKIASFIKAVRGCVPVTELVTVKETLIENYDILDRADLWGDTLRGCQASLADEERRPKEERKEKIQFTRCL